MAAAPRKRAAQEEGGYRLKVADSDDYGRVLMSKGGMALYLFTKDGKGPSDCYGDCATAWPPTDQGQAGGGKGVDPNKPGTGPAAATAAARSTYGGAPVYFYIYDRPGSTSVRTVRGSAAPGCA